MSDPSRRFRASELGTATAAPRGPALALLELESIARGFVVADALLKRAQVEIVLAEPTSPGKFLILFTGEVAEVEESLGAGREAAGATLIDTLHLTYAHPGLLRGLRATFATDDGESLGVVETHTAASVLRAVDIALKAADVKLTHLHLARGVGGKGWLMLTGALHMIEAALEAVTGEVQAPLLLATELVQRPHPDLLRR